jgi:predicted O-linked N-acetylglucosamine transferase (SPINDLY family)
MLKNLLKFLIQYLIERLVRPIKKRRAHRINEEAVRLWDRGDMAGTERLLREAIEMSPTFARACSNLGTVLWGQHRFDDGMALLRKAVELDPRYAGARVNLGVALYMSDATDESVEQFREALRLDPENSAAHLNILMPLLDTCDWDAAEAEVNLLSARWRETRSTAILDCISPFVSLLVPIPQEFRLQIARHHSMQASRRVASAPVLQRAARNTHRRLRIGYLSADLHNHATAHLATGLFEQHDRSRFESFAYSFGADDGSDYRRRLVAAFDHFIDISNASHHEAAQRIANDAIDILIDLKGHTEESRPEIMALRPAPIQVNYLGFPGTMGADFIDYIVADPTVIPVADIHNYTEKIVWMPACYQVNDHRQRIADRVMQRAEFGLPEGFVFCSFNKHFKIERSLFNVWLGILANAQGSVLWLQEGPGEKRLRAHASQRGVDPERLIFARLLPKPEHLARLRLADLFLDTLTYNAHTTASDALWAGLPLLTCPNNGFAGRVAASLLKAIGLPELIAADLAAYERQAIAFARNPEPLRALAGRLEANRLLLPLFDTVRFTRDLERAYETMWERHVAGAAPQAFAA